MDRFKRLNVALVAISADPIPKGKALKEQLGLDYPLLSDVEDKTRAGYRIIGGMPATFVLDGKGIIQWKHVGVNAADRPASDRTLAEAKRVADQEPMAVSPKGKRGIFWAELRQRH